MIFVANFKTNHIIDRTLLEQSSKNYAVAMTTHDSAFNASLALRFNANQQ